MMPILKMAVLPAGLTALEVIASPLSEEPVDVNPC